MVSQQMRRRDDRSQHGESTHFSSLANQLRTGNGARFYGERPAERIYAVRAGPQQPHTLARGT
jgi:hypothetical protein